MSLYIRHLKPRAERDGGWGGGCERRIAVRIYRIRHYLGPTYDESGHHVGKWSEVKFATLDAARAHQRLHGGTLYRPKVYERPKKGKRSRTRQRSEAVQQPLTPAQSQEAIDQGGLLDSGSHI
jgi:hypothetical protein